MTHNNYHDYLKSQEWQEKRSERLLIDQYKCQRCGSPMHLNVHHLNYDSVGNEDVYNDLITLCKYCHQIIEDQKNSYKNEREHYNQYNMAWKSARRIEYRFCKDYEVRDLSGGGSLRSIPF